MACHYFCAIHSSTLSTVYSQLFVTACIACISILNESRQEFIHACTELRSTSLIFQLSAKPYHSSRVSSRNLDRHELPHWPVFQYQGAQDGNESQFTHSQPHQDDLLTTCIRGHEQSCSRWLITQQLEFCTAQATGAEVLNALHSQRDKILHAKGQLQEADNNLATSKRLLKKMSSWLPW